MSVEEELRVRSENACELCAATDGLVVHGVTPDPDGSAEKSVLICETCQAQVSGVIDLDVHHWRCLTESAWSQVPAVQVMAWRMLKRLSAESWAVDLLDMLYLQDDILAWARQAAGDENIAEDVVRHLDSNGAVLTSGDTVTLIKDLNVKGAGFTAKRGTAVRNISLVPDNAAHIEGRINGQQIVILTEFVKK
jgi:protein PhnA